MYNSSILSIAFGQSYRLRIYSSDIQSTKEVPPAPLVDTPFTDDDGNVLQGRFKGIMLTAEERAEESVRCSLSRSRNAILRIVSSFPGKYFCTFTFSKDKVDRYSYDDVSSAMKCFLRSLSDIDGLQYIIVPELHKDGAFHFHGIFNDKLPVAYAGKFRLKRGRPPQDVFHILNFSFGFTSAIVLDGRPNVCYYLTKYLTKESCSVLKGKRRYWYSFSTIDVVEPEKLFFSDSVIEFLKGRFHFHEIKSPVSSILQVFISHDDCLFLRSLCSGYQVGSSYYSLSPG